MRNALAMKKGFGFDRRSHLRISMILLMTRTCAKSSAMTAAKFVDIRGVAHAAASPIPGAVPRCAISPLEVLTGSLLHQSRPRASSYDSHRQDNFMCLLRKPVDAGVHVTVCFRNTLTYTKTGIWTDWPSRRQNLALVLHAMRAFCISLMTVTSAFMFFLMLPASKAFCRSVCMRLRRLKCQGFGHAASVCQPDRQHPTRQVHRCAKSSVVVVLRHGQTCQTQSFLAKHANKLRETGAKLKGM